MFKRFKELAYLLGGPLKGLELPRVIDSQAHILSKVLYAPARHSSAVAEVGEQSNDRGMQASMALLNDFWFRRLLRTFATPKAECFHLGNNNLNEACGHYCFSSSRLVVVKFSG